MKKILFSLSLIIFSIVLGLFVMLEINIKSTQKDNINLEKKLKELSSNYNSIKEENSKYEEEINNLKKDNESLIEEQELWKETKEKIEASLS